MVDLIWRWTPLEEIEGKVTRGEAWGAQTGSKASPVSLVTLFSLTLPG